MDQVVAFYGYDEEYISQFCRMFFSITIVTDMTTINWYTELSFQEHFTYYCLEHTFFSWIHLLFVMKSNRLYIVLKCGEKWSMTACDNETWNRRDYNSDQR